MASVDLKNQLSELQVKQAVLELELSRHKKSIRSLSAKLYNKKPAKAAPLAVDSVFPAPPALPTEFIKKLSEPVAAEEKSSTVGVAEQDIAAKTTEPEKKETTESQPESQPKPIAKAKKDMRRVEMDFGKIWFVRVGIISLLTGLVFLSNFAYHNFIYKWGATPRLVGLYILSAILIGLGHRFEKAKTATTNYGRVLAAGGIATMYYASYGAHYLDRLRIIDSPIIGGVLLLISAAVCMGYALWKKSNITAICSIVLAFYSTSINPVGGFAFVSGIILTLTGMVLLDRLKSAAIGFATMLGCYLSFSFWQLFFNHGSTVSQHTSWFVLGYWILCTAVILKQRLSLSPIFNESKLLTYTTINNSLFVILSSMNFNTHQLHSNLWAILAGIGISFIAISVFLQLRKNHPESLLHLYLGKGIALITLALCIKLTGSSLAISLTVQAALALVFGYRSHRALLKVAGYLSLTLGFFIYAGGMGDVSLISHTIVFTLYMSIAVFLHREISDSENDAFILAKNLVSIFALISLTSLIWHIDVERFTKILLYLLAFNVVQTMRMFSVRGFMPEVFSFTSHLLVMSAGVLALEKIRFGFSVGQSSILTVTLFLTAAMYMFAAVREKMTQVDKSENDLTTESFFKIIYLILPTGALLHTLWQMNEINLLLIVASLLPMLYHWGVKQLKIESLFLIGFSCYILPWFLVVASFFFNLNGWTNTAFLPVTQLICAAIPIVHYCLIRRNKLSIPGAFMNEVKAPQLAFLFHLVPAIIMFNWQQEHISFWTLSIALTAAIYALIGKKTENHALSWIGLTLYTFSLHEAIIMRYIHPQPVMIYYLVAFVPFALYLINKAYFKHCSDLNKGLAIGFSLVLWIVASQHVHATVGHSAQSICWAITGLFILSLGFMLRDIVFRSMAFIILAATVLHVYGVDVWKLGALLRIMSFITLGIVLLIIGYLYCRKEDLQSDEDNR